MGHLAGKDLYRRLGRKIDSLTARAPWNETLYKILIELYTAEEAELVVKMPYGVADADTIAKITGFEKNRLQNLLDSLADKGLVMDIHDGRRYLYMISPFVIGIFEFTMMRTRGELNSKEWARLFQEYLSGGDFYRANLSKGQTVFPLRVLPWEESIDEIAHVEILDYEKAEEIVEGHSSFAIGACSCRHEKLHTGEKKCDVPLDTCSTMGYTTDTMIRHGFARKVSREEMKDNLARSRDLRLVMCADNVQKDVSFICHCCGCCCNVMLGITRFGYTNTVVTSNYIARVDENECIQCGICVETCPVGAIAMKDENSDPVVNESLCIGCGVCALDCSSNSLKLHEREKRVFHPSDVFERVILQSLEQGTLQNLLFNNPQSTRQGFMRGVVGGFLKLPPVKKALMSDALRSRFLGVIKRGG